MESDIFWSEIGLGFGEPGGTLPPGINYEYPPEPLAVDYQKVFNYEKLIKNPTFQQSGII